MSKVQAGFNYGEEIENTMIKMAVYQTAKEERTESKNLIGAYKHLQTKFEGEMLTKCIDTVAELEIRVHECDEWLNILNGKNFPQRMYN